MARFLSGPPGGRTLPLTPTRLSDLAGGVYGPGASVASTGLNGQRPAIKAARARAAGETWEDILEYYIVSVNPFLTWSLPLISIQFNADRGETDFAFRLGKIFYHGSIYHALGGIASGGEGVGRVPRDFERARYYFESIARQVWPSDSGDGQARRDETGPVGFAAPAAGYLGRMYLRGEGVRLDLKLAKMWFERGAAYGDKECHNGLGIIWRDGLIDGRKDSKAASTHFAIAAGQDLAEAQVNLGKHHYRECIKTDSYPTLTPHQSERGDAKLAISYFEAAMRQGSPFEAFYYLAKTQASQIKNLPASLKPGACSIAASFFKVVTERGSWDEDLIRGGERAWEMGTPSGKQLAMLKWWIAAERGHEIGQNNLAFVLDQGKFSFVRCLAEGFLILAQTKAYSAAPHLRTFSHRTTRQSLRSLSGHDQPRRTILMP
jgi:SEL1 protein